MKMLLCILLAVTLVCIVPSSATAAKPFLAIPLAQTAPKLIISQGWNYSEDEQKIHPDIFTHYAVDFEEPWGTPVYAPADGYALASYHTYSMKDSNGITIGYGLGLFVQIWHEQAGVYSSYSHLSGISPAIPYYGPVLKDESWQPQIIYTTTAEFKKKAQPIRQGDLIGYIGYSGLLLRPELPSNPPQIDPAKDPSWDPHGAHLHWEIFTRTPDGLKKDQRFDPFNIYGEREKYADVFKKAQGLIMANPDGSPVFAHR